MPSFGPAFESRLLQLFEQSSGLGARVARLAPTIEWQVRDKRVTAYTSLYFAVIGRAVSEEYTPRLGNALPLPMSTQVYESRGAAEVVQHVARARTKLTCPTCRGFKIAAMCPCYVS